LVASETLAHATKQRQLIMTTPNRNPRGELSL
jgi:hypothetical protein